MHILNLEFCINNQFFLQELIFFAFIFLKVLMVVLKDENVCCRAWAIYRKNYEPGTGEIHKNRILELRAAKYRPCRSLNYGLWARS